MALKSITLRDFVIVHQLDLELSPGFTALTGETGAGKSILIDALQLALGERADSAVVREGAQRTDVCAEFDCPALLHPWLQEAGFTADEHLLLRRTVDLQGKSRAWINGVPATATQLRTVGEHLLDIHGQHAWQSLTRPDAVRGLLDAYAGIAMQNEVASHWAQWRAAQKALTVIKFRLGAQSIKIKSKLLSICFKASRRINSRCSCSAITSSAPASSRFEPSTL